MSAPGFRGRSAFTLLEIMISMALLLMLIAIAVPSLAGQLGRQRLQSTFDRLEALAATAQQRSMTDGKAYVIAWGDKGTVQLFPADIPAIARRKEVPIASLDPASTALQNGHYTLLRGSSLTADPAPVWTFWPSGNCEPVTVRYTGAAGTWEANFNALSGKGTVTSFIAH